MYASLQMLPAYVSDQQPGPRLTSKYEISFDRISFMINMINIVTEVNVETLCVR